MFYNYQGRIITANLLAIFATTALLVVAYNVEIVGDDTVTDNETDTDSDSDKETETNSDIDTDKDTNMDTDKDTDKDTDTKNDTETRMTLLCWDLLKTFYHLRPLKKSRGCSRKLVNIL
jgi:hypothetical protein